MTTVLFTADDGVGGVELWKTDGTDAGTVLVKDIRAGSAGSDVTNTGLDFDTAIPFAVMGGFAYFTGRRRLPWCAGVAERRNRRRNGAGHQPADTR